MKTNRILVGDCRRTLRKLPDSCVHLCLTSPPYFGLRQYGGNSEEEIGREQTPAEYVAAMVKVFREVRRVLRPDACMFLNVGDSYASNCATTRLKGRHKVGQTAPTPAERSRRVFDGIKNKDLIGIPWMLAFALRADGWWLRQDIIWHKKNGMTSSVEDRCTTAHEYVFLLTKSARYFFDIDAISEVSQSAGRFLRDTEKSGSAAQAKGMGRKPSGNGVPGSLIAMNDTRFPRSVWSLSSKGYKGAHFATMPPKLAEKCILAGTSEKGCCPECGTPWRRIVERERVATRTGKDSKVTGTDSEVHGNRDPLRHVTKRTLKGWKPGCECGRRETVPCVVCDPFGGSGTTAMMAKKLNRDWILCELYEKYAKLARERVGKADPGLFGLAGV